MIGSVAWLRRPTGWARPIARLRKVAIARGAFPVWIFEASSASVVSLTLCRASISPWPRPYWASWDAVGLVHGQIGDRVDALDADLAGARRPRRRRTICGAWPA